MPVHVDVLDEQESLRAPFLGSIALHATVAGLLVLSTLNFERSQPTWGGATHAGDAVPVSVFNHIPLPSKSGHPNPVANDTESQVPQAVKPAPKKKVQVPEKAQPIKSRAVKEQPKQQSLQR